MADSSYESMMHNAQSRLATATARIATLEAELAEARTLLSEVLPHLHHTGATHHQQCACSVKRRIEVLGKGEGT